MAVNLRYFGTTAAALKVSHAPLAVGARFGREEVENSLLSPSLHRDCTTLECQRVQTLRALLSHMRTHNLQYAQVDTSMLPGKPTEKMGSSR